MKAFSKIAIGLLGIFLVASLLFIANPSQAGVVENQWKIISVDPYTLEEKDTWTDLETIEIGFNVTNLRQDEPQRDFELGIRFYVEEGEITIDEFGLLTNISYNTTEPTFANVSWYPVLNSTNSTCVDHGHGDWNETHCESWRTEQNGTNTIEEWKIDYEIYPPTQYEEVAPSHWKLKEIKINRDITKTYYIKARSINIDLFKPHNWKFDLYTTDGSLNATLDPWWSSNYIYKMNDTVTNEESVAFINFPLLLNGSSFVNTSGLIAEGKMQADCDDIRYVNNSANATLPYEFENVDSATYGCDKTDTIIWVKSNMPASGSVDNSMYYDYSGASAGENKTGVWDSNFVGVWHFGEGSGLSVADSTGTQANGIPIGNCSEVWRDVKFGVGLNTSIGDCYISIADSASLDLEQMTVEAWINVSDIVGMNYIVNHHDAGDIGWSLGIEDATGYFAFMPGGGWQQSGVCGAFDGAMHYIVVTINSSKHLCYYDDGAFCDCDGPLGAFPSPSTDNMTFMGDLNTYSYDGYLDEVRISNIARSAEWINATYYSDSRSSLGVEEVGNAAPVLINVTKDKETVEAGYEINFTGHWTDADAGDTIRLLISDNVSFPNCNFTVTAGCKGNSTNTTTSPVNATYTAKPEDVGTVTWYAQVCDDSDACSVLRSVNFTYVNKSFSTSGAGCSSPDSEDPTGVYTNNSFFWVADNVDDQVYWFYMNGTCGNSWDTAASGNDDPYGITGNTTNLWVSDYNDQKIYVYKATIGTVPEAVTSWNAGCYAEAVATDNTNIWVLCDNGTIAKFDMGGLFDSGFNGYPLTNGLDIADNKLYTLYTVLGPLDVVVEYTTAGVNTANYSISDPVLTAPQSLTHNSTHWFIVATTDEEVYFYAKNVTFSDSYNVTSHVTPPVITIEWPANETTFAEGTSSVEVWVSTDENASCQYNNESTFNYGSGTDFPEGQGTLNHNFTASVEDGHIYNFYYNCKDSFNITNNASLTLHRFLVSGPPHITYVSPTQANGTFIGRDEAYYVNVTVQAVPALDTCLIDWNGTNESMTGATTYCYINKTGLSVGWYFYQVYANTTNGDANKTEANPRYIQMINNYRPTITITSPTNGQAFNETSVTAIWTGYDEDHDPLTYYYTTKEWGGSWQDYSTTSSSQVTLSGLNESRYDFKVLASDGTLNSTEDTVYFIIESAAYILTPRITTQYLEPPFKEQFRVDVMCSALASDDTVIDRMEWGYIYHDSFYQRLGIKYPNETEWYCNDHYETCGDKPYGYVSEWYIQNPTYDYWNDTTVALQAWNTSVKIYVSCINTQSASYNATRLINYTGEVWCNYPGTEASECFGRLYEVGSTRYEFQPITYHGWSYGTNALVVYGRMYPTVSIMANAPYSDYGYTGLDNYSSSISRYNHIYRKIYPQPVMTGQIIFEQTNYFAYPSIIELTDTFGRIYVSILFLDGKVFSLDADGEWQVLGYIALGETYTYKIDFDLEHTETFEFYAYRWHDGAVQHSFTKIGNTFTTRLRPHGIQYFAVGISSSLGFTADDCLPSYAKMSNGTAYGNATNTELYYVFDPCGDSIYYDCHQKLPITWLDGWRGVEGWDDHTDIEEAYAWNNSQWMRPIWDYFSKGAYPIYGGVGWYTDASVYNDTCVNMIMLDNIRSYTTWWGEVNVTTIAANETTHLTEPWWLDAIGWNINASGREPSIFDWDRCADIGLPKGGVCMGIIMIGGSFEVVRTWIFGNFLIFLIIISIMMGIGAVYGIFRRPRE